MPGERSSDERRDRRARRWALGSTLGFYLVVAAVAWPRATAQAGEGPGKPWSAVGPGVWTAQVSELGGDADWAARVVLVDPVLAGFSVQFDGARPPLTEWRSRFPDALALVNGSFWSDDGPPGAEVRPTCDLVMTGRPLRGAGCRRQDALFFGARARGDQPGPRLVPPAEFNPGEWSEAMKSFPALVRAGVAACPGEHYCKESSRTAALAQLKDGKLLLFASQWPAVRREVGRWLAERMGAVEAVNLDGGPEATLSIHGQPEHEAIGTPGMGLPLILVVRALPPPLLKQLVAPVQPERSKQAIKGGPAAVH